MRLQHFFPLFLLIGSLFHPYPSSAKTIHVPTDASSVKEAVELAVSGDEVVIDTAAFHWIPVDATGGIRIQKKNIAITGAFLEQQYSSSENEALGLFNSDAHPSEYSLLWIEDAHVVLKNLDLTKPAYKAQWTGPMYPDHTVAPIYSLSGSLSILNCTIENPIRTGADFRMENSRFIGNTFVSNHPAGYGDHSSYNASLLIHSAIGKHVEIKNCVLGLAGDKSYKQMELSNLQSCDIIIRDSTLESGTYGGLSTTRPVIQVIAGGPGIHIHDCTDIVMDLSGCRTQGGISRGADQKQIKPQVPPSGPGMLIENAEVSLHGGVVIGGKGGDGFSLPGYDAEGNYPFKAQSGKGGFGLMIAKSQVNYSDLIYLGGPGGPEKNYGEQYGSTPPGSDGDPLFIDAFSTFQEFTSLPDWSVY